MNSRASAFDNAWLRALVWLTCLIASLTAISCGGGGTTSGGSTSGGIQVAISPSSTSVAPSGNVTFQATVTGTLNQQVTWTASIGTINAFGIYTAPTLTGTYTITATSQADPTKSATAQVVVSSGGTPSVTVSPTSPTVGYGSQSQFTAVVSGGGDQTVTWTASSGTIDSTGLFTAPSRSTVVTVRAHSVAFPTASGAAAVTVTNTGPIVQVTPAMASAIPILGTFQFAAKILNVSNQQVTWTATGGTVSTDGLYTAGSTPGNYLVTATSVANPTVNASATITVKPVHVVVSPGLPTIVVNQSTQFSAIVSGITNQAVRWTASAGTITSSGVFTAPSTPQSVTVTATSVMNPGYVGSTTVSVVNSTDVLYTFNAGVPDVWSPVLPGTTPSGVNFLGRFDKAQTATLTLGNLTPHSSVTLKFDVYIIGAWTGITGASPFVVNIGGSKVFSQTFSNVSGDSQSYPDGNTNTPGTGATATNSLGYSSSTAILYNDAIYHVVVSNVSQTANTVTIVFSSNLSGTTLDQMSWGLKNVEVIANP